MMHFLSAFSNPLPYHILSYGALLGMELFQSFINTKICYKALPPREFLLLQKQLFPVYFRCQLGLVLLTALTRPPMNVASLVRNPWDVVPLALVTIAAGLNLFVFGPRTTTAGFVRKALQESANDEKNANPPTAGRVLNVNRTFSQNHAMSIHLNAIALVATIAYGFLLGGHLSG